MVEYASEYFINSDGLRLFYRDYNTAPAGSQTIFCMPGLTRNSKDFAGIAKHVSKTHRVICVEQRGRGLSDWDPDPTRYRPDVYVADMIALLQHLKLEKPIAFGTSLGGLISMLMAATKPGMFAGILLNDIGPEMDPRGVIRLKSYLAGNTTPAKTWPEVINALKTAAKDVYPTFTDAEWEENTNLIYTDVDGSPVLQYDQAISTTLANTEAQTGQILWQAFEALYSTPVLALRGALSDLFAAETLTKMATMHPDLMPVTVPDRGHVPLMTEPECIEAIDIFLKKCA